MAAATTWTELKAELADWLNRDDLTTQIPNFITYAENRFNRELFGPEREASSNLSASGETVALPADFWGIRSVYLNDAPRRSLEPLSLSELRDMYPVASTGKPRHYAIVGGNMHLGPVPNGTYTLPLSYYQTIPALGSGQASNWVLASHPDLYIAASLTEAMVFLRDHEGLVIWEGRTQQKLGEINKLGTNKRFGASPLYPRSAPASVSRHFHA